MKALFYKDVLQLRGDVMALAFLGVGLAMPLAALVLVVMGRIAGPMAPAYVAGGLAVMLMVVAPMLTQGMIQADRRQGIMETFHSSGRTGGAYLAGRLLFGTVPVVVYVMVICAIARVAGVAVTIDMAVTVISSVAMFCIFLTLGGLLTGGDAVTGLLLAGVLTAGLIGSRFVLPMIPATVKFAAFLALAAVLAAVEIKLFNHRFVTTIRAI